MLSECSRSVRGQIRDCPERRRIEPPFVEIPLSPTVSRWMDGDLRVAGG